MENARQMNMDFPAGLSIMLMMRSLVISSDGTALIIQGCLYGTLMEMV